MRRILACVSVVTLLLLGSGCAKIRAREAMQKGISLYKANKYEQAAESFKKTVDAYPNWAEAWLNRGYACKQAFVPGSTSEKDKAFADCAIESFKKYVELTPPGDAHDSGIEYLITAFNDARRQSDALTYFKPAYDANPTDIKTVKVIRAIYQSMGDFTETTNWVEKEMQLTPDGEDKALLEYTLCALYENKVRMVPSNVGLALLTDDEKFDFMARGIERCDSAMKQKEDFLPAIIEYSLLHRFRNKLALQILDGGTVSDPVRRTEMETRAAEDLRIADEYRDRAGVLSRKKREEEAKKAGIALPPAPAPATPAAPSAPATPASAALPASGAAPAAASAPASAPAAR